MKRFAFKEIKKHLNQKRITLLLGARQVGKTTLVRQLFEDLSKKGEFVFMLSLEDKDILRELNKNPKNIFQLIPPLSDRRLYLLIDEIQYLSDPSNFLKYHFDHYQDKIKFVVTGSSSFYIDRKFKDSLAGRKRIFELPTLNLAEVFHFKGRDELIPLLNSGNIPLVYKDEIRNIFYEYLIYGGYPEVVLEKNLIEKKLILKELWEAYAKKDAVEAFLSKPESYSHLLKLLAGRIGSLLNINSLASDIYLDNKTIEKYLWVMRKSFHIHYLLPFYKNIASELRKMPKLYFADLGLRNSLLNNFTPIGLREDKGELIENYVYLLLYNQFTQDNIRYWRTQKKQEVDFIVQNDIGTLSAYEVKYNRESFKESKYHFFRDSYPDIPLECIDVDLSLEYSFTTCLPSVS